MDSKIPVLGSAVQEQEQLVKMVNAQHQEHMTGQTIEPAVDSLLYHFSCSKLELSRKACRVF